MLAARVQALIGRAGETITYKRVTHGAYSTATLQSNPPVQSYTVKAGVRQYRAKEIKGLIQQGDREVRIAASDLRFNWVQADLPALDPSEARELVVDAWRMVVPKKLARAYDLEHPNGPG